MFYKIFFKPESLAEISRNVALVFFASAFLEPLLNGTSKFGILLVGLIFSFILWIISLILTKE